METGAPAFPAAGGRPEPEEPESKRVKTDLPAGVALSELGLTDGARLEVAWEVEMTDDTDEVVWWGAILVVAEGEAAPGEATLRYDAKDDFAAETHRVVFLSRALVLEVGHSWELRWRLEGAEAEADEADEAEAEGAAADEAEYAVGSAVKARFQGGDVWHAGTVAALNDDGTLDVLYEDRTCEQGIPREFVQRVELAPNVAAALVEGDAAEPVAESIDDFFNLFVTALTSGATFQRLDPEKQQLASEKVRAMRPHFDAELHALKDERGHGATVTGEDIKVMLPRVMVRNAQAMAQAQAAH